MSGFLVKGNFFLFLSVRIFCLMSINKKQQAISGQGETDCFTLSYH